MSPTAPVLRRFLQLDVFADRPQRGNPLAVVLDADDLSDADMQRVARWTNLSETTFLLAPTTQEADYRVRIFTPSGELPFAGHPTLGTARAWLWAGGEPTGEQIIQECAAGLITVRRDGDRLAFAAPPLRRSGPLEEADVIGLASALGVPRSSVLAHAWADNGPGWRVLELESAQQVLSLAPDLAGMADAKLGVLGRHSPALTDPADTHAAASTRSTRSAPSRSAASRTPSPAASTRASPSGWWAESRCLHDGPPRRAPCWSARDASMCRSRRMGTIWIGGVTVLTVEGSILV